MAWGAPFSIDPVLGDHQAGGEQVGRALNVPFDASTAFALVTFQSEDHQEALAALREKRLPVFKDR